MISLEHRNWRTCANGQETLQSYWNNSPQWLRT